MNSAEQDIPSTRPYLIRALHEWCSENGFSPYLAVKVDETVRVPMEFVKNGEIVLNVGFDATSALRLGNEFIEFKARFGGVPRDIAIPISHVIAIYARENGQGMAFPAPPPTVPVPVTEEGRESGGEGDGKSHEPSLKPVPSGEAPSAAPDPSEPPPAGPAKGGGRPALRRVK